MRPPVSKQQTNVVLVEIYCPTKNITIEDFLITPSAAHEHIIESIKVRFKADLEEVWPCDINGEPIRTSEPGELIDDTEIEGDPVYNFSNVQNGERIIVRASMDERFTPEIKHETVLYLGNDMGQDTFKAMSRQDRRNHVRVLRRSEAVQRKNIIRLTSPHTDVTSELAKARYPISLSSRMINDNWKIAQWNPLDRNCLGAMAILSEATCGQPWVLEHLLIAAVASRLSGEQVLQESDILKVIEHLYQEANAIGSTWDVKAQ